MPHKNDTALALSCLLAVLLASAALPAAAADEPAKPGSEQVVVPEVQRREVKLPRIPNKDFEIGVYGGVFSTQNFGSSAVGGLKLGYHITEDVFVQAAFGQTKVSDEAFRQILPGGVFVDKKEKLSYYNLSAGFNILPGEVFIGSRWAKASQVYLIGGLGSTKFVDQRRQTFNLGMGLRVLLADRFSVQVDLRDHIFKLDLLGRRDTTQNIELTTGLSYFF